MSLLGRCVCETIFSKKKGGGGFGSSSHKKKEKAREFANYNFPKWEGGSLKKRGSKIGGFSF